MDVINLFEYPLPILNKEQNKIFIEASKNYKGTLTIKNDGGGVLEGRIMSNSHFLIFEPEHFSGNICEINYTMDLNIYNTEDTIHADAVIVSNGGEHTIKFLVKIAPHILESKEGYKITSLKDFLNLYKKNPTIAKQLFVSYDFMVWLYESGYEYMDLYEHFKSDANKERGLNNFFIFNKLKHKSTLVLVEEDIHIKINPYVDKIYTGVITVRKLGFGFVEESLLLRDNSAWLKLEREKITSSDFKTSDTINLAYTIDKSLIGKSVESDTVMITNGSGSVNIAVTILKFLNVKLEKTYIDSKEDGYIVANNYSGQLINIEVIPRDNFVKFGKAVYEIDKNMKIPFSVKMSAMQLLQKSILKNPIFETEIDVKSHFQDKTYIKTLKLTVGNFK